MVSFHKIFNPSNGPQPIDNQKRTVEQFYGIVQQEMKGTEMSDNHVKRNEGLRLKDIIITENWNSEPVDIGIIGIPFDEGVMLSGGRVGSAKAPDAIREQIQKYGTAYDLERGLDFSDLRIVDYGNVLILDPIQLDNGKMHEWFCSEAKSVWGCADTLITFGGGHDNSYATIRALCETNGSNDDSIGGMNVDAHLDVRPTVYGKITSGTPFRRLIEGGHIKGKHFFEIGIQGHVNEKAHRDWLEEQGARIFYLSEIVRSSGVDYIFEALVESTKECSALFVSVDMDSVAQAFAPGVSAPSPDGLFPQDVLEIAYLAGVTPTVKLFEIMEVNPVYDRDGMTCRLAANMVHSFLSGYSTRKENQSE